MKTKDLVIIALYSVLIIVSTQIKIPLGPIPMTLQVFTITFGALKLSQKQILGSLLIFVLIAFIGVAKIAGNVSGPEIFLSPTFPYILGFFTMSTVINARKDSLGVILGYFTLYLTAMPILFLYMKYLFVTNPTIISILTIGWIPFIITDVISMTLAFVISKRVKINN